MFSKGGGRLGLALIVLATIGCDRLTKQAAVSYLAGTPGRSYLSDTVWVGYVENRGGFLSLGANLPDGVRTAVFTIATGIMLCAMAVFVLRRQRAGLPVAGLALFIAGGISNWIDRIARGSVVDFLNIGLGPVRTGVFNLADVAIMAGAGFFVFTELRDRSPSVPEAPPLTEEASVETLDLAVSAPEPSTPAGESSVAATESSPPTAGVGVSPPDGPKG